LDTATRASVLEVVFVQNAAYASRRQRGFPMWSGVDTKGQEWTLKR